jgi:hypothetical protein
LIIAVAALAVAGCGSSGQRGQGSLVALIAGGEGVGQPTAVGKPMSISGDLIVKNTGSDAVVLDRVELVGLENVTYLGAYAVPFPPHETPFTADFTYRVPPDGRVLPGVTVAPHTKAWIVVGLTPTRGQHQWTRMDLIYHDGAATYRRHVAISGAVCAPSRTYLGHCHAPGF